MVRKKLAVAILALSAFQANFADAMGLGNLSVKSALNQPLSAEIKLLETGDLDPSQIKIQLAGAEDFQRAGVDRDFFLTNLRFTVNMDGNGNGTIKVTTREPVVEPYLNFVIEARWPNGRLLREFAVLLDPPTFSAAKAPAPITPATSAGAQPVKPKAAQPPVVKTETETAKSIPDADVGLPAADKSGEYRVQVYDTMAKIAARFKPANDVSVAQTMIAIQRANPQVFIRNNVNLIKSGYVLRLPSADEVRSITAEQASQEVDSQTQEWRGGPSSSGASSARSTAAGPQLDASAPEPTNKEGGYREQARLSIATTGDADKGGSSGKGVDALRQQLTQSQEALEKGKRDNKELQSRLDDMERQIATLQRLISLKDEQLAAVQEKSAAAAKTTPQQPVAETAPVLPAPTPATPEPAPSAEPAAEAPAPQVVAPAPKPAPKPAAKPAPVAEPSFVDKIIANRNYLLGLGLAAIVLALGIPMLIKRKRRQAWLERQEEESVASSFNVEDRFQFDTGAFDDAHGTDDVVAAEAAAVDVDAAEQPVAEAPKKTVRSETGDPIAESDIYIAYGRYQQAVDLLTSAIDAEPNRSDLRTKLLEVYVEMRNKEAFRQQFVALQSLGDSSAVAHVKDLLSSVDGISDWLDDLPGSTSSSNFATAATTAAVTAAAVSTAPDLDLDLDFDDEPEPTSAAPTTDLDLSDDLAALETSFDNAEDSTELDLDLDDDLLAGDLESDLSDSFLDESKSAPSFDNTFGSSSSFEAPKSFESSEDFESKTSFESQASFESPSSFETTDSFSTSNNLTNESFNTPSFESASVTENASLEDDGLELDLGDDDLDQALSDLGEAESLGDLEDMTDVLGARNIPEEIEPMDLSADLDLPEEFDLSQTSIELPEVERPSPNEFGDLSFDEPIAEVPELAPAPEFEPAPAVEPEPAFESEQELDVFAGLNEPEPAPIAPAPSAAPEQAFDGGDDFDFLADADEVATKLDLARAYIDMGDTEGARDILDEVAQEGTDSQKQEASNLLSRIS